MVTEFYRTQKLGFRKFFSEDAQGTKNFFYILSSFRDDRTLFFMDIGNTIPYPQFNAFKKYHPSNLPYSPKTFSLWEVPLLQLLRATLCLTSSNRKEKRTILDFHNVIIQHAFC